MFIWGNGIIEPSQSENLELFFNHSLVSIFTSGSTANIGNIMHNVSIWSRGIVGIVTILGVLAVVIIVLVGFFHLYNKYLAGM